MSGQEWKDFLDALEHLKFWHKSLFDADDELTTDGAFYLFEDKRNQNFHAIHRITLDDELRELGKFLINLAEIETEYENY